MRVGIGLPSCLPGASRADVLGWAREAEACGFASLATPDRVVFDNWDPFVALSAAAAVTEQIGLMSSILLLPSRNNAALVAKQAASLDRLSEGRFTLGAGVGGREDDFAAGGASFKGRGQAMDRALEEIRGIWDGQAERGDGARIGPRPSTPGGPRLILGANTPAARSRVARFASGWIAGAGPLAGFRSGAADVCESWEAAARPRRPHLMALVYFTLADAQSATEYLRDYYSFGGPYAQVVVASLLDDEQAIRDTQSAYAAAGCDELLFLPCSPELDQVERLAALTLGRDAEPPRTSPTSQSPA